MGSPIELVAGFGDVERHILLAIMMMLTNPGSLDQSPEPLDPVSVGQSLDIGHRVVDHGVEHLSTNLVICGVLVRHQNRPVLFDETLDESLQAVCPKIVLPGRNLGMNATTAFKNSDNRSFGSPTPALARNPVYLLISLSWFSADVGFIGFDDPMKKGLLFRVKRHCRTNTVHDAPYCRAAHTQIASYLTGT